MLATVKGVDNHFNDANLQSVFPRPEMLHFAAVEWKNSASVHSCHTFPHNCLQ